MVYVVVVFYVDNKSNYVNIKSKKKQLNIYYKNIINCFRTLLLTNKGNTGIRPILFTNIDVNSNYEKMFKCNDIRIILRPNNHIPPKHYTDKWQGTFYYIDAMCYFANNIKENDILFLVDPDCLFTNNINPIIESVYKYKSVNYLIEYDKEYNQNGLSRNELQKILIEEDNINIIPDFFGGEFYGFKDDIIKIVSIELENLWEKSLKRYYHGKTYFHTEEHIISYLIYKLDLYKGEANKYIKRMWTRPNYRNIKYGDEKYIIWHLPAEKDKGLIKIYNKLNTKIDQIKIDNYSVFFGKYLGIPKRTLKRVIYDFLYKFIRNIYKNIIYKIKKV